MAENDWKKRLGVVFSTNPDFNYEEAVDEEPETLEPSKQNLTVSIDRKGRGGKQVTLVTGFVGSSGKGTKPFPIPREQVEPVLKRMGVVDESMYDRYNENDYVKVIYGPLEGTEGRILSINRETGTVELETIFFGRATKVEVEFSEIERI